MAYQALYRAFRPQRFGDLVGQDVVARTLRNALRQGRLAHAYMFNGPRGTGKTSTALILAKAANCLSLEDGEPCGHCDNCRAFAEGQMLDVVEIDAASNRGIDEMRQLRDQVRFVPSVGLRKVYIIDEVHMLTTEAFNALLKTLEEPPAHALFILATTDLQKVPATVASRTQRFDFRRIPDALVIEQLKKVAKSEEVALTDEAGRLIAREAAGGLRDALSLLDQAMALGGSTVTETDIRALIGGVEDEVLLTLLEAIAQSDYAALFAALGNLAEQGVDAAALLRLLGDQIRQLFLARVEPGKEESPALTKAFALRTYEKLLRSVEKGLLDMRQSPDRMASLEVTLLDMALLQSEAKAPAAAPLGQAVAPSAAPAPPKPTASPKLDAPPTAEPAPDISPITEESPTAPPEQPIPQPVPPVAKAPTEESPAPAPRTPSDGPAVDMAAAWPSVLDALRKENVLFHAYLLPAKLQSLDAGKIELVFPAGNSFHYRQSQRREYLSLLESLIKDVTGAPCHVALRLEEEAPAPENDIISQTAAIFGADKINIIDK